MKALVTGATGLIGPHLVRALRARGDAVRCLARDRRKTRPLETLGAEVVEASMLDAEAMARALDGVDVVFNLAGGGYVSTATDEGLRGLVRDNVDTARTLLGAARGRPLQRIVHFSSISAMGVQLGMELDEGSPCLTKTPHEVAKRQSEEVALEAHQVHGTPVVILRPSQVYGPGDTRSEILKLARLAKWGAVPLFGGGEGLMPWVFVSDVVDAALLAAQRPEAVGRVYIINDQSSYRFCDVVRAMAAELGRRRGGVVIPMAAASLAIRAQERALAALGREPVLTVGRLRSMTGVRRVSIARAKKELGFSPKVQLQEGMRRTMNWYKEQRLV